MILAHFGQQIEFQVSPENENLDTDQGRISQRVLMVRSAYEDTEKIRTFFTEAFSPESSTGIGFLARYTFVPGVPVGNCTKLHLITLLRMQQQFHKNVFWYIWVGIRNINEEYPLLPPETSGTQRAQQTEAPQTQEQEEVEDEIMEEVGDMRASNDSEKSNQDPKSHPETTSLKRMLYEIVDERDENLIHAVYPSMDASKMYVLCSDRNKESTLEHLQKKESVLNQVFAPGATEVYFHQEGKPYVQNFPVLTEHQNLLVDSIVSLASSANPQEESVPRIQQTSFATIVSQSPAKRRRDGSSKPSGLPSSILHRNQEKDNQLNAELNETLTRLKQIESNEVATNESLTDVSKRLDQQANDISTLGKALESSNEKVEKVVITQVQQGKTMENMDGSLQAILSQMKSLNEYNKRFMRMAEPSQGGEVGPS